MRIEDKISVPLSGLASVNDVGSYGTAGPDKKISVPLSGLASVNPTPFQAL